MTLKTDLTPFLEFHLGEWRGLPAIDVDALTASFGAPQETGSVELGFYPAMRSRFASKTESGGFDAYSRETRVLMIETLKQPPVEILAALPEPMSILPNELLLQGAYGHEYLYGERGLVLTVAVPYGSRQPSKIARCRGIAPIGSAREFGPELYRPFEDRVVY